jgi:hypothetical protein
LTRAALLGVCRVVALLGVVLRCCSKTLTKGQTMQAIGLISHPPKALWFVWCVGLWLAGPFVSRAEANSWILRHAYKDVKIRRYIYDA